MIKAAYTLVASQCPLISSTFVTYNVGHHVYFESNYVVFSYVTRLHMRSAELRTVIWDTSRIGRG